MSKKKNTLRDLDEFLKQQAATLVSPERLSEKVEGHKPVKSTIEATPLHTPELSALTILHDLKALAAKDADSFRKDLYDLILKSLEGQSYPPSEDMMLINTVLYLKNGDNWKAAIKEYWKNKSMP